MSDAQQQAQRFRSVPLSSLTQAPSLPQLKRTARPDDRAIALLTDLRFSPLVVASHRDGLDQTLHVMLRAGVRMAFVSGANGELVGMVTADTLMGERPVLRALTHNVQRRRDDAADPLGSGGHAGRAPRPCG